MVYFRLSQLYVSHMCKRIFKFELQLSSYWQNIKFSRNCLKFNIFTKIVIFQVYLQLFRPTYKFNDRDMSGILFFIFASCEPLGRNEMWCTVDTKNHMSHICAKGFSDSNLNLSIFEKNPGGAVPFWRWRVCKAQKTPFFSIAVTQRPLIF